MPVEPQESLQPDSSKGVPCAECTDISNVGTLAIPHPYLVREWERDGMAIYYCTSCSASLVRSPNSIKPWRFAPTQ